MPDYNLPTIIAAIDKFLDQANKTSTNPVEANAVLTQQNLLPDSTARPGLPLRRLLRDGKLPHAFQPGGKNTAWVIPHSKAMEK